MSESERTCNYVHFIDLETEAESEKWEQVRDMWGKQVDENSVKPTFKEKREKESIMLSLYAQPSSVA